MTGKVCVPIVGPSQKEARKQLRRACAVGDLVEIRADLIQGSVEALLRSATVPALVKSSGDPVSVETLDGKPYVHAYHNCKGKAPKSGLLKLARTCLTGVDALRLTRLASPNTLAVGMGAAGIITRVLAPVMGSPFTYAALEEGLKSAPGQPSVAQLRDVYGYDRLSPTTKLYGVIGSQVSRSIGIQFHNAFFCKHEIDAVYLEICVPKEELEAFFEEAQYFPFAGLSVTMPHKQAVGRLVGVDGPINTLRWKEGKLEGTNTDGAGAVDALEPIAGKRVVILGAGGAGTAIAQEARARGAEVTVLNRTASRGDGPLEALKELDYDILVQATCVQAAFVPAEHIREGSTVMEIITAPTALMRAAQARGCRVIPGNVMFENQAARQQAYWGLL